MSDFEFIIESHQIMDTTTFSIEIDYFESNNLNSSTIKSFTNKDLHENVQNTTKNIEIVIAVIIGVGLGIALIQFGFMVKGFLRRRKINARNSRRAGIVAGFEDLPF